MAEENKAIDKSARTVDLGVSETFTLSFDDFVVQIPGLDKQSIPGIDTQKVWINLL